MDQPTELQNLIKASSENLELIHVIEAQIAKLTAVYGPEQFEAMLSGVNSVRSSDNGFLQMLLRNPLCWNMVNVPIMKKIILERRQKLEKWQTVLDREGSEEILEAERVKMSENVESDMARLQKTLKDTEDENQRLLKDCEVEKAQMKASLQKSQEDVTNLQKTLKEKNSENLKVLTEKNELVLNLEEVKEDVERLQKSLEEVNMEKMNLEHCLKESYSVRDQLEVNLQHSKKIVKCYEKAVEMKNVEHAKILSGKDSEFQMILKDSKAVWTQEKNHLHFGFLKSREDVARLQKVLEEKDDENQKLRRFLKYSEAEKDQKSPVNQESGIQKDSEIRELREELGRLHMENRRLKTEQPSPITSKPEQPGQMRVQTELKPEQLVRNGFFNPEQPNFSKTEQPIIHIPRGLSKIDERTPKDFQIQNLIQANRQLSVQQSDYHKTTSQEGVMTWTL